MVGPPPVLEPEVYCYAADDDGKSGEDAGDDVFCGVVWFRDNADAHWRALASQMREQGVMGGFGDHCEGREREVAEVDGREADEG